MTTGQEYSQVWREPPENKNRMVGFALLLTQVGAMVAYGIIGRYFNEEGAT